MTQPERLTWNQIRARYPDEWVVLVDADWVDEDDLDFRTAVVLTHSKGRRQCLVDARDLLPEKFDIAHLYTGRIQAPGLSLSLLAR